MIKIKEDEKSQSSTVATNIHVTLENNEEKTFEKYPIIIKSKEIKPLNLKIQKFTKIKSK
jgi:hypothetical protein